MKSISDSWRPSSGTPVLSNFFNSKGRLLYLLCFFSMSFMLSNTATAQVDPCMPDILPPAVTCAEFSMTYSDCPVGLGPNSPNGTWTPVGPTGGINNAVGGSFGLFLDLSTCVNDNCTALAELEYTLFDSYSENVVPGCSITLVNEWQIRDAAGNISPDRVIFKGTIAFDGTAAPVIVCPANVTLECGDPTDPANTGMATASSDCGDPAISWNDVVVPGCSQTETITRTWTATNGCGQMSTCVQTITVTDTKKPMFTDPMDEVIEITTNSDVCPYPVADISLVADPRYANPLTPGADFTVHGRTFQVPTMFSDLCDPDPQIYVRAINEEFSGSVAPCSRIIRVRWRVIDACDNFRGRDQLFTITDTRRPNFPDPADEVINTSTAGVICPYPTASISLTADPGRTTPLTPGSDFMVHGATFQVPSNFFDTCDPDPQIYVDGINMQVNSMSNAPCTRVIRVRWVVVDACDNERLRRQLFTINDDVAPVMVVPANLTLECGEDTSPASTGMATANDDCQGMIVPTSTDVSTVTQCDGGTIERTWASTDGCGNMATPVVQIITVNPPAGPTIVCPADMTVECFSDIVVSPDNATVTTDCSLGSTTVITGPVQAGVDDCPLTTYTYTYTVTDDCGRMASCEQVFTIENVGPTITCPADMTVECFSDISVDPADAIVVTSCTIGFNTVITGPVQVGPDDCPGTTYTYTYTTTDDCSRTISCEQVFTIDNQGPIIVCPADEVVTCFEDIDADPNNLTVTTSCGLGFFAYVKQPLITGGIPGCDGTVYTYIYVVVDDCGRKAECEQQFMIQNNAPTVTVPAGGTVTCFDEIEVSVSDVTVVADCDGPNVINVLPPAINGPGNCPGTTYTYTYRVKDFCNRIVEVDRVFTIGNNSGPIITSIPLNITSECEAGPSLQQFQAVSSCGDEVQTSVSDPVVIGTPGCSGTRIQYTYTATDACGRMASHVQTITLQNAAPTVNCPETLNIINCEDGNNNDLINAWIASVTATSSCGSALTVSNNYNGNAGMCINNGFTNVTFFATDQCGRTSTCVGTIIITDTEAPIIYQAPQEVLVPCNAVTQDIFNDWLATQGGAEAIDACWGNNISWSTNPSNPQLNCAGGPQAIVVEFIARDGCGNTSSVTGIFNTKVQPTMINISGQVSREDTQPIADVEMRISGGSAGVPDMDYTENGGAYGFPEMEYEDNLVLSPEKNVGPLNGVTTYDLILMQKHILLTETLDSPYKRIAADVNRSGSVTAFDLLLLRRLILHIDTEFTSNTSWRFVEADFVFPNADNPFETAFPETYNLSGLEEEYADFIGVKIGDLDLSSIANEFAGDADDRSGLEDLTFEVKDQNLESGEQYRIDFTAQNFEQINGFQFTLNFDQEAIEAISIEDADLSHFNENNYGMNKADNGAITLSWNHDAVQNLKADDVVFSLNIIANNDVQLSDVISISSEYTRAEAYQSSELMNVDLAFDNDGTIVQTEAFKLFQNQPNPFKEATMIGFNLPEAGAVSLKVYDVSGRLVYTQEGEYAKGYNQIDLDRADLPSGILYYHVNTANDSDSKKMILLK